MVKGTSYGKKWWFLAIIVWAMLHSTGPILGQIKITEKQMQDADDWEQI